MWAPPDWLAGPTPVFRRPVSPGSGLGSSTVRWGVTCRLAVSVVWHIPGMDARRAGIQAAPRWAVRAASVLLVRLQAGLHTGEVAAVWDPDRVTVEVADRAGTGLQARVEAGAQVYGWQLDGVPGPTSLSSVDEAVAALRRAWRAEGRLTVFTLDHCPACRLTGRQLERAGVAYMEIALAEAGQERAAFAERGIRSAPVVEVAGREPFGGFDPDKLRDVISTFPPLAGEPVLPGQAHAPARGGRPERQRGARRP